jgi:hypothetical protein
MPMTKIPTELSPDDLKALTGELTRALDEQERVKEEAAESGAEFRESLKGLSARIHELKEQIKSGRGELEIDVDERPGASGVIDLFRAGTNEKVGERPLRDSDRQADLFNGTSAPATDRSEEQDVASTPAEAEKLRRRRLEAEHADRITGFIATARESVTLTALDGGGYLAALMVDVDGEIKALRETGETAESAADKVMALYTELLPKFEPPPSLDDVAAVAEDLERKDEMAALEADQTRDAAGEIIEQGPPDDAPKTLLKPPKGKKNGKRAKVVMPGSSEPVDAEDQIEKLEGAATPPPETAPSDCFEDCYIDHKHTKKRLAF